jgi:hypothetical protein
MRYESRMVRSTFSSKCPPGVLCLSPGIVVFGIIVAIGIFLYMSGAVQQLRAPLSTATSYGESSADVRPVQPISITVASAAAGDDRYMRAPKPERNWIAQPDYDAVRATYGNLPAVATRGVPEAYQSMGVINLGDGKILPLYGRRTAYRSDRFQYYTRTDSYNPVQLPVSAKGRSCQDDNGCEELMDGETVKVIPLNKTGPVTIYRFNGPTYIPGVL